MEQRLRYRASGDILLRNHSDLGSSVLAPPTSRYTGGPSFRTGTQRDPAGRRAHLLSEHLRPPRHSDHSDLCAAAFWRQCQLQRRLRRFAHQDQQNRQDLRLGLQIGRSAALHQSDLTGLHRRRADRPPSK